MSLSTIDTRQMVTYPGAVLQVVSGSVVSSSTLVTTSTTPVSVGVSLSITPISATSKIIVSVNGIWGFLNNAGGGMYWFVYKNGSNISGGLNQNYSNISGVTQAVPTTITFVDTPATINPTTYALYVASRAGNQIGAFESGSTAQITLMEIAG